MEYGVIGEHLKHSFSKEIHEKIGDYGYEICEVSREDFDKFMRERDFRGINVTIPYKELVIPYLHYIDPTAEEIGAVNTIVNRSGKLYGYNTDFYGLKSLIIKTGADIENKKVLVFGSGGTSKTAEYTVKKMGAAEVLRVSRSKKDGCITYEEARNAEADVIINTTPAGMYPNISGFPDDLENYASVKSVVDVIYNPLKTELVLQAERLGKISSGGLYMLVSQAVYAAMHFEKAGENDLDRIYGEVYKEKENVVLTGMPGSGKTTAGKIIAEKLNFKFIDTDDIITEKYGNISDIFAAHGEEYFRKIEKEVILEASAQSGAVISTGGGAVLADENIKNLHHNGKIYFIDRPISDILPTSDRPLSSDRASLEKRYAERFEIYKNTADFHIKAGKTPDETAERIVKAR